MFLVKQHFFKAILTFFASNNVLAFTWSIMPTPYKQILEELKITFCGLSFLQCCLITFFGYQGFVAVILKNTSILDGV